MAGKIPDSIKRLPEKDFWLFDEQLAVVIRYDEKGSVVEFLRLVDELVIRSLVRAKQDALLNSTTLEEFLPAYEKLRSGSDV